MTAFNIFYSLPARYFAPADLFLKINFQIQIRPAIGFILHAFLSSDFFLNQLFRKKNSGIPFENQTDWIEIRPDVLSCLIWVQTVCKGYQRTTLAGAVNIPCIQRMASSVNQ